MSRKSLHILTALFLLTSLPAIAQAQDYSSAPPPPGDAGAPPPDAYGAPPPDAYGAPPPGDAGAPPPPAQQQAQVQTYTPEQLDQMIAPIALYPDPLLSQILMASTYPLEVVEAHRWLQDPANSGLQGQQMADALQQQSWDPSVKSLVAVPQVLKTMNDNLQWTEQLGDAFLAQQSSVMDSVQRLRGKAQVAGTLRTTPQEVVSTQGPDVIIQPANPDVIYVPAYNPGVVYGTWMYAAYPPYYFPDVAYAGFGIGFGAAIALGYFGPFWGWDHWDWYHHGLFVDQHRWIALNGGRPIAGWHGDTWHFDPAHRRGVPYRSAAVRARFQGAIDAEARRSYRGYAPTAGARAPSSSFRTPTAATHVPTTHGATPASSSRIVNFRDTGTTSHSSISSPSSIRSSGSLAVSHSYAVPSAYQHSAPAFESFSHGFDVRGQSERGAYSRSTMPSGGSSHGSSEFGGFRYNGGGSSGGSEGGRGDEGGHR